MITLKTLLLAFAIIATYSISAQIAVTTDGSSAHGSAMLEVKSTAKGFLPPRMTQEQIEAIITPAAGLMVFNTDNNRFYFYDNTAAVWKEIAVGSGTISPVGPFSCGDNVTFMYSGVEVTYGTVSGQNGTCWMDRNLGASQVATSSTDAEAYGDLYQWGRLADGHEKRNSGTTSTLSSSDVPGHSNFITSVSSPWDWRSPQNHNLWQGVSGTNNPCPDGYRLPTEAEWNSERSSWAPNNNAAGAFASPLKLPMAGFRGGFDGSVFSEGSYSGYWSSSVNDVLAWYLYFYSDDAFMSDEGRAYGASVRCLKD
jgi:uncharacterized protein (TIGR02145 family)